MMSYLIMQIVSTALNNLKILLFLGDPEQLRLREWFCTETLISLLKYIYYQCEVSPKNERRTDAHTKIDVDKTSTKAKL